MLVITGASDDLIEVDGDLVEEFTYQNEDDGDLIAFSDGTLLRVKFSPDGTGNWRITPVHRGAAKLAIEQTDGEDSTDRATLDGDVRWVCQGGQHHLVKQANAQPATPSDGNVVTVRWVHDELVQVEVNGVEVASANHDEQGWDGMGAVIKTAREVGKALGATIEDAGTPNL